MLSVERDGAVALVTLRRPEKRNALSIELRERLAAAFAGLAGDDGVACGLLTGEGSAFCAGMDVTQFGGDRDHQRRLVESSVAAFGAVARFPKPLVAAVNGPAIASAALGGLPEPVARELCLTGRLMDAEEALRHGMVARVVEDGAALAAARELADAARPAGR